MNSPPTNCPSSYLASVEFLESGCHIGSVFMVTLSSYSLFLMVKKSPVAMKSTVPYMINLHVLTMICDLTWAVVLLPMFFMPVIAAHASGILVWFTLSPPLFIWLSLESLGGMCAGIVSLFENRHQIIVTNSWFVMERKWTRRIFSITLYTVMFNFGLPEVLTIPEDQESLKVEIFEKYPCIPVIFLDNTTALVQKDASLFNPHMYLTCLVVGSLVLFFVIHTTWSLLPRNNPSMSSGTRKMLTSFFISMCIQVAIPVVVIYIPNIYWNVSITFDIYSQELNNISIVLFTLHGTSSSIATIFLYEPYRKYTKSLILYTLLRLPEPVETSTVVSVVSGTNVRRTTM